MRYKLAIFDMDGTILNTLDDLTDAANYALHTHNMPPRSIDEIRSFVGNGIRKLIERAIPDNNPSDAVIDEVQSTFMDYYRKHSLDKTAPYPGIVQLMHDLKDNGCFIAIATNKAHAAAGALAESFFPGLIDLTVGEQPGIAVKPASDEIVLILNTLHVNAGDAVYLGDSDVDFATASNSGLDFIAVDWGFRSRDFLASLGARTIVSTPHEVLDYIL